MNNFQYFRISAAPSILVIAAMPGGGNAATTTIFVDLSS